MRTDLKSQVAWKIVTALSPAAMLIRAGEGIDDLATLLDIFAALGDTANVIADSRPDAWKHIDTLLGTLDHLRAWKEERSATQMGVGIH